MADLLVTLIQGTTRKVTALGWRTLRFSFPAAIVLFALPADGDLFRGSTLAGTQAAPGALFPKVRLRSPAAQRARWPWRDRNFVQLQSRPGLRVRSPRTAWGTPLLVRRLQELGDAYQQSYPAAPPISIHDLSVRQGGRLPLHASHRDGLDVDIRLPLRRNMGYVNATPQTLDRQRTWFIISKLVETCDVEFILLDRQLQHALYAWALNRGYPFDELEPVLEYPRRPSASHPTRPDDAVVRHFRKHANHLHVRFRAQDQPLRMRSARAACRRGVALAP